MTDKKMVRLVDKKKPGPSIHFRMAFAAVMQVLYGPTHQSTYSQPGFVLADFAKTGAKRKRTSRAKRVPHRILRKRSR